LDLSRAEARLPTRRYGAARSAGATITGRMG
jgi:hypothetical protein